MPAEDTGLLLGAVIFGLTHLIAWNFDLPTPIEKQLWRFSSVVTTCIFATFLLSIVSSFLVT